MVTSFLTKSLMIPTQKVEKVQYSVALAITGTIRETSKKKLYRELGFESLKSKRLFHKLSLFYLFIYSFIQLLILR